MSRRWLILTGLAGLAIVILSVAAPYLTVHEYGPFDVPVDLTLNAAGASFLAVGWVAAWLRPQSRIGLLMMAVGLLWFAVRLSWIPDALMFSVGAPAAARSGTTRTRAPGPAQTGRPAPS